MTWGIVLKKNQKTHNLWHLKLLFDFEILAEICNLVKKQRRNTLYPNIRTTITGEAISLSGNLHWGNVHIYVTYCIQHQTLRHWRCYVDDRNVETGTSQILQTCLTEPWISGFNINKTMGRMWGQSSLQYRGGRLYPGQHACF